MARVIGGLQYVKPAVSCFANGRFVVPPRGLKESVEELRLHVNMNQRYVHRVTSRSTR
jgi:hypothetical protein